MTTLITTVLTWGLTYLTKNAAVDKYNPNRVLLVRMLAALLALISAALVALVGHSAVDSSVIGVFVDALVAWLAAIGLYHAPQAQ